MKIKLIVPADKKSDIFLDYKHLKKISKMQALGLPLALPTLAALTPKEHQIKIIDENVEDINYEEKVDLVGITFFTYLAPRAYEIADRFREKGVKVVLGGIHTSAIPEEAIKHADSIVVGEAEETWPRLVDDLAHNKLQKVYKQEDFPSLDNAPIPRWDLVDINKYYHFTMQIGRGCPHNCEFCSVHSFNGRIYRHKPLNIVLKEIKYLKSLDPRKSILFVDDNILSNIQFSKQLFEELIPLKIRWWSQASIDRLQDDKLLELMHRSGCGEIFIGLESVSKKSLEAMGKTKANKIEEYEQTIEKIHNHGIAVFGSFMFGSDSDDKSIFDNTFEFIQKNNIPFSMLNILGPVPGAAIYDKFKNNNRIITHGWSKYTGEQVCFRPKLMTAEELQKGRDDLVKRVYLYKNMYKRLKKLWQTGVLTRDKKNKKLFTKGRVLLTFKIIIISPFDFKRIWFIFKCLWNPYVTSVTPVILALNFHDYSCKNNYYDIKKFNI